MISPIQHKDLFIELLKKDLTDKYQGSFLGFLWSFATPLLMLGVYTFVFGVVFQSRWGLPDEGPGKYAIAMFIGLLIYGIFSDSIIRSTGIISANQNYVKKVVFPLELFPHMLVLSALIQGVISLAIWFAFFVTLIGAPPLTSALFLVVILPLVLMSLGFCFMFAALGVYFRDITQLVGIIMPAIMFLSPIFYPKTALPEIAQHVLPFANPIAIPIEQARLVLIEGKTPDWISLGAYTFAALIIYLCGTYFFAAVKRGFADVL